MGDATDRTASPGADREDHLAHVDGIVGCVEIWEYLSAKRDDDRETKAE